MNQTEHTCGCCAGIEKLTPMAIANRPGLSALSYRAGTHASFLETMQARLSSHALEIPLDELDENGKPKKLTLRPLQALRTRAAEDPALALLDAWALVADVLTYYQERFANEGFLRTATERRSVLELARLVGYALRPGVAASVFLAFTVEDVGHDVEITAGTRAQSLPGPGELPQSFETCEKLLARVEWNDLKPRMTRPQIVTKDDAETVPIIYFQDTATNLKPGDLLLLVFSNKQVLRQVLSVEPQFAEARTKVTLKPLPGTTPASLLMKEADATFLNAIQQKVGQYLQQFGKFGKSAKEKKPVKGVVGILQQLKNNLAAVISSESLGNPLGEALQRLRSEHKIAVESDDDQLISQLGDMVIDLEKIASSLFTSGLEIAVAKLPSEPSSSFASTRVLTVELPASNGPSPTNLTDLLDPLTKPPFPQPANARRLKRSIEETFTLRSDIGPRLLTTLQPVLGSTLYEAWAKLAVPPPLTKVEIYALRLKAPLFGHNLPLLRQQGAANNRAKLLLALDAEYKEITKESWVVIEVRDKQQPLISQVKNIQTITLGGDQDSDLKFFSTAPSTTTTKFGETTTTSTSDPVRVRATLLTLSSPWLDESSVSTSILRGTTVYFQSEPLKLADEPIDIDVQDQTIELDRLYDGLDSGRWLIVSGERTDIPGTSGVLASELVMLTGVIQGVQQIELDSIKIDLPSDHPRTTIQLANNLAFKYKRGTVKIYGTVVKATHGETRHEVLGSGEASKVLQQFELKQSPLTHAAASNPTGVDSTLHARVNDVEWHEVDSLVGLKPADRRFITRTDDEDKTTIIFGNGREGARLPTGIENITAVYRNGIGKAGNVKAGQISLLATKPLGAKSVINPLRASGGADKENRDQARRNAPLAVMALDRLVSVQDYADFARTFAGIGKAHAVRLPDGRREIVHVTIAGAEDIPIDETSDLFINLRLALHQFGDPFQPIQLAVRELLLLIISANVRVLPDYQWESVAPKIRAALLETFSFERREFGQEARYSEVVSTIQGVEGVAYVDLDILEAASEQNVKDFLTQTNGKNLIDFLNMPQQKNQMREKLRRGVKVNLAELSGNNIAPAQIAYLTPEVPETLILKLI